MPGIATGYLHHVVERGNNRERVFFDRADRELLEQVF